MRIQNLEDIMMHIGLSFAFTCVILPIHLHDYNIRTDSLSAIPAVLVMGAMMWISYLTWCITVHALFHCLLVSLFKRRRESALNANKVLE
jgi:predicted branched-subunit amino acid permease